MAEIKKLKIKLIAAAVIAVIGVLIYFGIFWWLLLGLIVLTVILLHFSINIHVKASKAEGIDIKGKYLFLTLYPRNKSSKKKKEDVPEELFDGEFGDDLDDFDDLDDIPDDELPELPEGEEEEEPEEDGEDEDEEAELSATEKLAKKHRKDKKDDDDDEDEKKEGKLASLRRKYEKIKPYIPMGWKATKKLCKAIRFDGFYARVEVGRFDAHEAAIYYGIVQGTLFRTLGWLANIFTVKMKKADVNCHFNENIIEGETEFTVRVRPSTVIAIAFCAGVNFLIIRSREKRRKKQEEQIEQEENAAEAAA